MGTNYYYREKPSKCGLCGHIEEGREIHIGKRSHGWKFLFDRHCKTHKEWVEFVKINEGRLFDEYDNEISADELINDIFETKGDSHNNTKFAEEIDGYDFTLHPNFR